MGAFILLMNGCFGGFFLVFLLLNSKNLHSPNSPPHTKARIFFLRERRRIKNGVYRDCDFANVNGDRINRGGGYPSDS